MNLRAPHHIYIHFPYCLYKCHYCDFNSFAVERGAIPSTSYVDTLVAELAARRILFEESGLHSFAKGTRIDTIFLGGGTPSLMQPGEVEKILLALSHEFQLAPAAEVTLEANPGTLDATKIRDFKSAGITRLSIGVQSLEDRNLARFGRIHSAQDAKRALHDAVSVFAGNVSADLIYGFPDQTFAEWQSDLEKIAKRGLSHLSCYSLTAEAGTQFAADVRRGIYHETTDELMAEMFLFTQRFLQDQGLNAYEVSNFSKTGSECRHNLGYWHYESYLGIGAGACSHFVPDVMPPPPSAKHSVCGVSSTEENMAGPETPGDDDEDVVDTKPRVRRTTNHKIPETYQRTLQDGDNFFLEESIDRRTAMSEFMMMGLRLREGVGVADFKLLFGEDLQRAFAPRLNQAVRQGEFQADAQRLRVAPSSQLQLNRLLQMFLV